MSQVNQAYENKGHSGVMAALGVTVNSALILGETAFSKKQVDPSGKVWYVLLYCIEISLLIPSGYIISFIRNRKI